MPSVALGVPFQKQEFMRFGINVGSSSVRHVVIDVRPHLMWSFTFMVGWGQNVKVVSGTVCSSTMTDFTKNMSIESLLATPPRGPHAEPECPPAPARVIKTNTIALHRGRGENIG